VRFLKSIFAASAQIYRMNMTHAPAAADFLIDQDWSRYSPQEHVTWDRLFQRQTALLKDRAAPEFLAGLDALDLGAGGVPDLEKLSRRLMRLTGWRVEAVPGLIPAEDFFRCLAERTFVAGRFIRRPDQMDYLEEPDIFHDVFGHTPLLADPVFADYMQAYGEGGLKASRLHALEPLSRLYWYTVEFGLIRTDKGLRNYGAGIVSSPGETVYALESERPRRLRFDLARVMRTRYQIDRFQETYFVIDSFEDLLGQTLNPDFTPLYQSLKPLEALDPDRLYPGDQAVAAG
jgi:phenylalanine-4-hydroxylase